VVDWWGGTGRSDHHTVHAVIRYSDDPAPPQRWTLSLYLLQNSSTVAEMQTIINSHRADTARFYASHSSSIIYNRGPQPTSKPPN
jgi:hypothetical protein